MTGSVGRRIEHAATSLALKNYEECAIHFFPALDKTAKLSFPHLKKVAPRIKTFLHNHQGLITFIATHSLLNIGTIGSYTFPQAIYELGRCSIAHEGELDKRLRFSETSIMSASDESWELHPAFLTGMMTAVILSHVNSREKISDDISLRLFGQDYIVNDLWGHPEKILQSEPFCRFKGQLII